MMIFTTAAKALGGLVLILAVLAGPAYTENVPTTTPPTAGERAAWALTAHAQAEGMTCQAGPSLTDHVIVRTPEAARVISFDVALDLTSRGSVTVVAYCHGGGK